MKTIDAMTGKSIGTSSMPAVTSKTMWDLDTTTDMAQQELEERKKEERQHSSKSIFTSRIVCGCCGGTYGSKVWHSTDKYHTVIWQCNNKVSNSVKCTTPHIKDDVVKEVYLKAVNQLISNKEPALEMMRSIKERLAGTITVIDKNHYKVRFKSGFETNVEI